MSTAKKEELSVPDEAALRAAEALGLDPARIQVELRSNATNTGYVLSLTDLKTRRSAGGAVGYFPGFCGAKVVYSMEAGSLSIDAVIAAALVYCRRHFRAGTVFATDVDLYEERQAALKRAGFKETCNFINPNTLRRGRVFRHDIVEVTEVH